MVPYITFDFYFRIVILACHIIGIFYNVFRVVFQSLIVLRLKREEKPFLKHSKSNRCYQKPYVTVWNKAYWTNIVHVVGLSITIIRSVLELIGLWIRIRGCVNGTFLLKLLSLFDFLLKSNSSWNICTFVPKSNRYPYFAKRRFL